MYCIILRPPVRSPRSQDVMTSSHLQICSVSLTSNVSLGGGNGTTSRRAYIHSTTNSSISSPIVPMIQQIHSISSATHRGYLATNGQTSNHYLSLSTQQYSSLVPSMVAPLIVVVDMVSPLSTSGTYGITSMYTTQYGQCYCMYQQQCQQYVYHHACPLFSFSISIYEMYYCNSMIQQQLQ